MKMAVLNLPPHVQIQVEWLTQLR